MNPIGKKFDAVISAPDDSTEVIRRDYGPGVATSNGNSLHLDVYSPDKDYSVLMLHEVERTPTGQVARESWSTQYRDGSNSSVEDGDGDGTIDSAWTWSPGDAQHPDGQRFDRTNAEASTNALPDFPVLKAPIRG